MVTAPSPPAALPRPALDSHTHLDMIDLPVAQVVAAARAAGIVRVVTVGTDLATSRWSARQAGEHEGLYAAVAIHPNEAEAVTAEALGDIEALAALPHVEEVDEDGGLSYPVITGRYDGSARWASAPLRPGTPLAAPVPLFAKLDTAVVDEELARLGA